jgi:hypothetical protein
MRRLRRSPPNIDLDVASWQKIDGEMSRLAAHDTSPQVHLLDRSNLEPLIFTEAPGFQPRLNSTFGAGKLKLKKCLRRTLQ